MPHGKRRRLAAPGFSTADRYVALHHYMLRSDGWKALSPDAKAVLIQIWQRHNGQNNGAVSYSVREAAEIGISRTKAAKALTACVEMGFLAVTRDSAFSLKTRAARLWRITAEPYNGEPASKDFMRWHPPVDGAVSDRPKSRIQSRRQDLQSRPQDREARKSPEMPSTVPPVGLSALKMALPQSRRQDTSIIPGRGGVAGVPTCTDEVPLPSWVRTLGNLPEGQYAGLVARLTQKPAPTTDLKKSAPTKRSKIASSRTLQ